MSLAMQPKKSGRRKPSDKPKASIRKAPLKKRKAVAPKGKPVKRKQPSQLAAANAEVIAQAARNRKLAFELRSQRMTYRQIAAELGVSVKIAFNYVADVFADLKDSTRESAELVRAMELETLDVMQARWEPLAIHEGLDVQKIINGAGGEPVVIRMEDYDAGMKAVDRVLKIQERRAKLLGLDAATKVEGTVQHTHLTLDELEQRMRDAEA